MASPAQPLTNREPIVKADGTPTDYFIRQWKVFSGDAATVASLNTKLSQGEHTLVINAAAMTSRPTNGAATGTTETATHKVTVRTLDFDQTTVEYAQIQVPMPKSWNEGTITVQFIWTATATGEVVWGVQALALGSDDLLDSAFGAAQTVVSTASVAGELLQSAFTSAVTIAGPPAEGDTVWFQFYRDAGNVADTLAADAKLIGVRIMLDINAGNDA